MLSKINANLVFFLSESISREPSIRATTPRRNEKLFFPFVCLREFTAMAMIFMEKHNYLRFPQ